MSDTKLKPCPFCGGAPSVTTNGRIYCANGLCCAKVYADTKPAWNARATDDMAAVLRELVLKLNAIHENSEYQSVWILHQIHNGPYTGPKYAEELTKARAALSAWEGKG